MSVQEVDSWKRGVRASVWTFAFAVHFVTIQSGDCAARFNGSESDSPRLMKEVRKLRPRDLIPRNLIQGEDPAALARALVLRLHERYERILELENSVRLDWWKDTELQLLFQPELLEELLSSGEFLNQHESLASGGLHEPETRSFVDDYLLGLRIDAKYRLTPKAKKNKLRAKYVLIEILKRGYYGKKRDSGESYGPIAAVFKDEVKLRATWTLGDSLDMAKDAGLWDQRCLNCKRPPLQVMRGGKLEFKYPIRIRDFLRETPKNPNQDFFLAGNRSGQGTFFRQDIPTAFTPEYPSTYPAQFLEGQVYGPLHLSDVHHFMIDQRLSAEERRKILSELRRTGLAVYEFTLVEEDARFRRKRGQLLLEASTVAP